MKLRTTNPFDEMYEDEKVMLYDPNRPEGISLGEIKESRLQDYDFSNRKNLNPAERKVADLLEDLKELPHLKDQNIVVKKRNPLCKLDKEGRVCNMGYIVKRKGKVVIVTHPIRNEKDLTTPVHEMCHAALAHHDPQYDAYQKTQLVKEKEAEACTWGVFKELGINYKPDRTEAELEKLYKR